jgi:hypothetical protein
LVQWGPKVFEHIVDIMNERIAFVVPMLVLAGLAVVAQRTLWRRPSLAA